MLWFDLKDKPCAELLDGIVVVANIHLYNSFHIEVLPGAFLNQFQCSFETLLGQDVLLLHCIDNAVEEMCEVAVGDDAFVVVDEGEGGAEYFHAVCNLGILIADDVPVLSLHLYGG